MNKEELSKLSVSELKKRITAKKLSFADCVEKSDLIERAFEAESIETPVTLLPCETLPALEEHKGTMIFLHGLGDTSENWTLHFRQLQKTMPNMKLVLPTAPKMHTKVAGHTTAWHDIEDFSNLMAIKFGGIETSLQFIKDIIDKEKTYIPLEKIIVGGFSQGGALALYCGAKIPNLGGIVCLSGFVPKMTELAEISMNMKVFMGHGKADPLVQYVWGEGSAKFIESKGAQVEFKGYEGLAHSSSEEELKDVISFVNKTIKCE